MESVVPEEARKVYQALSEEKGKVTFNDWVSIIEEISEEKMKNDLTLALNEFDENLDDIDISSLEAQLRGLENSSKIANEDSVTATDNIPSENYEDPEIARQNTSHQEIKGEEEAQPATENTNNVAQDEPVQNLYKQKNSRTKNQTPSQKITANSEQTKLKDIEKLGNILKKSDCLKDLISKKINKISHRDLFKEVITEIGIKLDNESSFPSELALLDRLNSSKKDKKSQVNEFLALVLTWTLQTNPVISFASPRTEKTRKKHGLDRIFKFYSRQIQIMGKSPTFDFIDKSTNIMEIGVFIRFCRDFDIISSAKSGLGVTRSTAQQVFQKNAKMQKEMDYSGFIDAVHELAKLFGYSQQQFYEYLQIFDPVMYTTKMHKSSVPFHINTSPRVSEDDYSKRYKFDFNKHNETKLKVQEWRNTKARSSEKSLTQTKPLPKLFKTNLCAAASKHRNLINGSFTWTTLTGVSAEHLISKTDIKTLVTKTNEQELKMFSKFYKSLAFKSARSLNNSHK